MARLRIKKWSKFFQLSRFKCLESPDQVFSGTFCQGFGTSVSPTLLINGKWLPYRLCYDKKSPKSLKFDTTIFVTSEKCFMISESPFMWWNIIIHNWTILWVYIRWKCKTYLFKLWNSHWNEWLQINSSVSLSQYQFCDSHVLKIMFILFRSVRIIWCLQGTMGFLPALWLIRSTGWEWATEDQEVPCGGHWLMWSWP